MEEIKKILDNFDKLKEEKNKLKLILCGVILTQDVSHIKRLEGMSNDLVLDETSKPKSELRSRRQEALSEKGKGQSP